MFNKVDCGDCMLIQVHAKMLSSHHSFRHNAFVYAQCKWISIEGLNKTQNMTIYITVYKKQMQTQSNKTY
jgi:hypothetical protein